MPRPGTHEAHGQRLHLPPRTATAAAAVLGSSRTSPVSKAAPEPGTKTPGAGRELGGGGRGGGGSLSGTLDEVRQASFCRWSREAAVQGCWRADVPGCRGAGVPGYWCAVRWMGFRQESTPAGEVVTP